jgi:glucosamine kinase
MNKKLLIADSGSTKTSWAFLNGDKVESFETKGINPVLYSKDYILEIISEVKCSPDKIYFFGAGCGKGKGNELVLNSLNSFFPYAKIEVDNDIKAANIALNEGGEGLVGILGTGSYFMNFDSEGSEVQCEGGLGYLLGDEGSGAHIGKLFITEILNNTSYEVISKSFFDYYSLNRKELIKNVYSIGKPNKYLAEFSKFVFLNKEEALVKKIIEKSFAQMYTNSISKFVKSKEISLVGSIAYYFEKEIRSSLLNNGVEVKKIIKSPINEMITYFQDSLIPLD